MKSEKVWYNQYPESISPYTDFPIKTMVEILGETVAKIPDHIAIKFYSKEISYKELWSLSTMFASSLQQAGVNKRRPCSDYVAELPSIHYIVFWHFKNGWDHNTSESDAS